MTSCSGLSYDADGWPYPCPGCWQQAGHPAVDDTGRLLLRRYMAALDVFRLLHMPPGGAVGQAYARLQEVAGQLETVGLSREVGRAWADWIYTREAVL